MESSVVEKLNLLNRVLDSHDFSIFVSRGLYKCSKCGMKGYKTLSELKIKTIPAHLITCEEEQIKNIIE